MNPPVAQVAGAAEVLAVVAVVVLPSSLSLMLLHLPGSLQGLWSTAYVEEVMARLLLVGSLDGSHLIILDCSVCAQSLDQD